MWIFYSHCFFMNICSSDNNYTSFMKSFLLPIIIVSIFATIASFIAILVQIAYIYLSDFLVFYVGGVDILSREFVQWHMPVLYVMVSLGIVIIFIISYLKINKLDFNSFVREIDSNSFDSKGNILSSTMMILASAVGFSIGFITSAAQLVSSIIYLFNEKILKNIIPQDMKQLLLASTISSLIATIFVTPIFATLFVMEVVLRDKNNAMNIFFILISSVIGYTAGTLVAGNTSMFLNVTFMPIGNAFQILIAIFFGIFIALFIHFFNKGLKNTSSYLDRFISNKKVQSLFFILSVSFIALAFPQNIGSSLEMISIATYTNYVPWFVFALLMLKSISVIFTYVAGFRGDLLLPSIALGALFGSFIASLMILFDLSYGWGTTLPAMGIASFVAGVYNAPLAAIILIIELSRSYNLLLPVVISVISSITILSILNKKSAFWFLGK